MMTFPAKEKTNKYGEQRTVNDVAKEMTDHYRHTGVYRAEDVIRVLGDPRTSIAVEVVNEFPVSKGLK